MPWKEEILLILDDNNNHNKNKEDLHPDMSSPATLRMLKSYVRRNFVLPVLASSCFLVLLWLLLLNSRQERHLKQVVADERARQYYLAASDGADLKENYTVCSTQWGKQKVQGKVLHVVTPTYRRPEQIAELTRLAQTIDSVKGPLHWIVVTDSAKCDETVEKMLQRKFKETSNSSFFLTILSAPMPEVFRSSSPALTSLYGLPRGVAGRRAAIKFVMDDDNSHRNGILYFADDDNSYDSRLFEELRKTVNISMFPVGLLRPTGFSSPLLDSKGRVVGFVGQHRPHRSFPIDMAGFAVGLSRLRSAAWERMRARKGLQREKEGTAVATAMPYRATYEEEGFLTGIGIKYEEIEPLANNCTKILVWHTMTAAPSPVAFKRPKHNEKRFANLDKILEEAVKAGMANWDEKNGEGTQFCVGMEECSGNDVFLERMRKNKNAFPLPIF